MFELLLLAETALIGFILGALYGYYERKES